MKLQSRILFTAALCLFSLKAWADTQIPIKFGILSIAPPARIHAKWQPFVDYISAETSRPVEIVVPRGFGKMKNAAANGEVDFFYVNSHVFYRLKQEGKAIGVAQMKNIDGKVTSRSDIFVRKDSGITNVSQLKGKSIAFVSPMGAGGYLAPRAHLYGQGIKTKIDTKEVFTKNLSNSIHKVLLGDIAAATMCGVNYNLMSKKIDTGELITISASDPYPENVVAAGGNLDPKTINQFRQVITSMAENPRGQEVLALMRSMKIENFLEYDPDIEDITRNLLTQGQFSIN